MLRKGIMQRITIAALVGMLAFGIAGVRTATAAPPSDPGLPGRTGAHLTMAIEAVTVSEIGKDGVFTDTIIVKNDGMHAATDVLLTVPYDSAALKLVNVSIVRESAWVTKLLPSAFIADLDRISSAGDTVRVAVTFAKLPGYTDTKGINAVVKAQWTDGDGRHTALTDMLLVKPLLLAGPQIAAPVTASDDTIVKVYGAAFQAGEIVTFWYNTPVGTAAPLYIRNGNLTIERRQKIANGNGPSDYVNNSQYLVANEKGQIATLLGVQGLRPGDYSIVARGMTNSATIVVPFSRK